MTLRKLTKASRARFSPDDQFLLALGGYEETAKLLCFDATKGDLLHETVLGGKISGPFFDSDSTCWCFVDPRSDSKPVREPWTLRALQLTVPEGEVLRSIELHFPRGMACARFVSSDRRLLLFEFIDTVDNDRVELMLFDLLQGRFIARFPSTSHGLKSGGQRFALNGNGTHLLCTPWHHPWSRCDVFTGETQQLRISTPLLCVWVWSLQNDRFLVRACESVVGPEQRPEHLLLCSAEGDGQILADLAPTKHRAPLLAIKQVHPLPHPEHVLVHSNSGFESGPARHRFSKLSLEGTLLWNYDLPPHPHLNTLRTCVARDGTLWFSHEETPGTLRVQRLSTEGALLSELTYAVDEGHYFCDQLFFSPRERWMFQGVLATPPKQLFGVWCERPE